YFRVYWGNITEVPQEGSVVKNLPSRLSNDVSPFVYLVDGKMQFLAIPSDLSLVSVVDLDALRFDVTKEYSIDNQAFPMTDAGNRPVNGYKLLIRRQGVAYTSPHRHEITLKRI